MVQMSVMEGLKAKILKAVIEDEKWDALPIQKRLKIQKIIDEEFLRCGSPKALVNPKWLRNLYKRIKEAKEENE
jgi:hypothetical protein